MTGNGKICVFCGEDCSNRPRVKDPEGHYACRACAERNAAAGKRPPATTVKPVAVEKPIGLEPEGLGDLDLSDLATDAGASDSNACPGCGMPRAGGAVVCMSCGHNSQTGGKISTKVKKVREPKEEGGISRLSSSRWAGAAAGVLAMIGLPAIGMTSEPAMIAAYIAAFVWVWAALIMMIVAAFKDGDSKWGIIGICSFIPCLGGFFGLAFTLYYCIFGSERSGWKANYWLSVGAAVALIVILLTQYPELAEKIATLSE